ncbi:MAG TPA: type II secretion system protein [Burkholderiales bacterium]|nr:type II secretion system protein [Burkholderiales bacterium]
MFTEGGIRGSWLSRQHGLTLIELVLFILIVSVSIAGIFLVLYKSIRTGSDPVVRKQAIAIAESLLEEVELMPFTYCDTNDANVLTATGAFVGAGGCAATVQGIGPQAGETRYSSTTPFDNVGDYSGFDTNTASPSGICDITGTCNSALGNYRAQVTVAQDPNLGSIAQTEALRITVTVTGPGNTSVTLDGYRTRYAPNTTQ